MNDFAEFLYKRRRELGLTQQNIADELGISNKAVSKWESGESFPETAQLVPLANILGCTVDELLRGKESARKESAAADAEAENEDGAKKHVNISIDDDGEIKVEKSGGGGEDNESKTIKFKTKHFRFDLNDNDDDDDDDDDDKDDDRDRRHGNKGFFGKMSAVIFPLAFIVFFVMGAVFNMWHPAWVAFPIAAILVPVFSTLAKSNAYGDPEASARKRFFKLLMKLTFPVATIVFLVLGFAFGWWHPAWVAFPIAVFLEPVFHAFTK